MTRTDQLRAIRATAEKEIERLDADLGASGVQHNEQPTAHTSAADDRRDWAVLAYLADARLRRLEGCDDARRNAF